MKKNINDWENMTILCEAYIPSIKEALLEKEVGEKVVIFGEVAASDGVNGYCVDIKRVK